jgi:flagellar protein FlgJ
MADTGVPASVTIARSILESGWGESDLSKNDNNYFGIKCFEGDPGPIATGCRTYTCDPARRRAGRTSALEGG